MGAMAFSVKQSALYFFKNLGALPNSFFTSYMVQFFIRSFKILDFFAIRMHYTTELKLGTISLTQIKRALCRKKYVKNMVAKFF